MILAREAILDLYERGHLVIDPFEPELVGPNSVNVRLGDTLYYRNHPNTDAVVDLMDDLRDFWRPLHAHQFRDHEKAFILQPRTHYLGTTAGRIGAKAGSVSVLGGPENVSIVPEMKARSTTGRNGLTVAICAGLGDVGYSSRWTLEICNLNPFPVVLVPGVEIGQVVFHTATATEAVYGGSNHYQVDPEGGFRIFPKPYAKPG